MSDFWWHNIPQHKVGDLVRPKHNGHLGELCLVTGAKPKIPCRVNPEQSVRLVRVRDGWSTWKKSKDCEGVKQ